MSTWVQYSLIRKAFLSGRRRSCRWVCGDRFGAAYKLVKTWSSLYWLLTKLCLVNSATQAAALEPQSEYPVSYLSGPSTLVPSTAPPATPATPGACRSFAASQSVVSVASSFRSTKSLRGLRRMQRIDFETFRAAVKVCQNRTYWKPSRFRNFSIPRFRYSFFGSVS